VSSVLDGAEVLRQTACYLPVANTGTIVAGELQRGVFVATGHTCWGILNGPATGQVRPSTRPVAGGGLKPVS